TSSAMTKTPSPWPPAKSCALPTRSEERRVGKECRSGGAPEQYSKTMMLAVRNRHGGVAAGDQDVCVNVVGGIRVQATAADLPVLLSVLSSLRDRPFFFKQKTAYEVFT